jgi:hypothetical protein
MKGKILGEDTRARLTGEEGSWALGEQEDR